MYVHTYIDLSLSMSMYLYVDIICVHRYIHRPLSLRTSLYLYVEVILLSIKSVCRVRNDTHHTVVAVITHHRCEREREIDKIDIHR